MLLSVAVVDWNGLNLHDMKRRDIVEGKGGGGEGERSGKKGGGLGEDDYGKCVQWIVNIEIPWKSYLKIFLAQATTKYAMRIIPTIASELATNRMYPRGFRSPYPRVVKVTMLK